MLYLLALCIVKLSKNNNINILTTCLVIMTIGVIFKKYNISLPWEINVTMIAFPLWGIGYLLKPYLKTVSKYFVFLYIISFSIAYYNFTILHTHVDMSIANYGNIILFYISGIAGSIATIALSQYTFLLNSHLIKLFGKDSLYLYGAAIVPNWLIAAIGNIIRTQFDNVYLHIIIDIILSIMIIIMLYLIKPIYDRLYNFLCGIYDKLLKLRT